jgi:hypothetical protein
MLMRAGLGLKGTAAGTRARERTHPPYGEGDGVDDRGRMDHGKIFIKCGFKSKRRTICVKTVCD